MPLSPLACFLDFAASKSEHPAQLQVNLEFLVADKRTFLTDKEQALQTLFGEANDVQETFNAEIVSIADRVATAFASLKVQLATKLLLHSQISNT